MINWVSIAKSIAQSIGRPFSIVGIETLSGGCINTAFRISDDRQYFFIKLNDLSKYAILDAESAGLHTINAAKMLRTPKPICFGHNEKHRFYLWNTWSYEARLMNAAWAGN